MSRSIIASEIVRDYKIEQFYKNRNRNKGDKNNEKVDKTKCRRIHKEMQRKRFNLLECSRFFKTS